MPLVITESVDKFDDVQKRDFIRAQYQTWPEPRNGIVTAVSDDMLTAIFLPGVNSAACYFTVKATEVAAGKWIIKYSTDLTTIKEAAVNGVT